MTDPIDTASDIPSPKPANIPEQTSDIRVAQITALGTIKVAVVTGVLTFLASFIVKFLERQHERKALDIENQYAEATRDRELQIESTRLVDGRCRWAIEQNTEAACAYALHALPECPCELAMGLNDISGATGDDETGDDETGDDETGDGETGDDDAPADSKKAQGDSCNSSYQCRQPLICERTNLQDAQISNESPPVTVAAGVFSVSELITSGESCARGYTRVGLPNVIHVKGNGRCIAKQWTTQDPEDCRVNVHYAVGPLETVTCSVNITQAKSQRPQGTCQSLDSQAQAQ